MRSLSARDAPVLQPRCFSRARDIASSRSTAPPFPVTPSPPTSSTRPASARSSDGACSTASSRPAARRSTPMRSTSDRLRIAGSPAGPDSSVSYAPRRTALDKLLVDAAAEAGAEVREGFTVEELVFDDGRVTGHSRPWPRRVVGHRARARRRRCRRLALDARTSGARRAIQREAAASGRLLHLLERTPDERPLRSVCPPVLLLRGVADERRPHARHRGVAVQGVRGKQVRYRRQLSQGHRPRAELRRTPSRRPARRAVRRHGGAELFPQALRSGLGSGGRRGLQQGLHHGAGNPGRVPRRRVVRRCAGRVVYRRALIRRGDGRLPVHARSARPCVVRIHGTAGVAGASATRDAATARRGAWQPTGDGRVRTRQRRRDVARGILLRRKRQTYCRGGPLASCPEIR